MLCVNMLLAIDGHFVHRARGKEGKDGNPLNEVRMLCGSVQNGGSVLVADQTIEHDPLKSVLGLAVGDAMVLARADFVRLSEAFLFEVEREYL